MSPVENLASILYENYCREVGGKAFNGDPLPDWATFSADTNKQKQVKAWISVANQAVKHVYESTDKELQDLFIAYESKQ